MQYAAVLVMLRLGLVLVLLSRVLLFCVVTQLTKPSGAVTMTLLRLSTIVIFQPITFWTPNMTSLLHSAHDPLGSGKGILLRQDSRPTSGSGEVFESLRIDPETVPVSLDYNSDTGLVLPLRQGLKWRVRSVCC